MVLIIITLFILVCIAVSVLETRFITVTDFGVMNHREPSGNVNEQSGNPFKGRLFRIVVVSDLHCTRFGKKNSRLICRIRDLKPDLLLVAGDVINSRVSDIGYAKEFFSELKTAGINTLYTFGNHEQKLLRIGKEEYEDYKSEMDRFVRILNNETITIGSITIKGLLIPPDMYRDRMVEIRDYFDAERLVGRFEKDGNYHILVAHDPTFADLYRPVGADLIIGGHLHGGLVRLPFVGGLISPRHRIFPKKTKGLFDEGKSRLLVTSGIGWHALPIRFLNNPEICVFSLEVPDNEG